MRSLLRILIILFLASYLLQNVCFAGKPTGLWHTFDKNKGAKTLTVISENNQGLFCTMEIFYGNPESVVGKVTYPDGTTQRVLFDEPLPFHSGYHYTLKRGLWSIYYLLDIARGEFLNSWQATSEQVIYTTHDLRSENRTVQKFNQDGTFIGEKTDVVESYGTKLTRYKQGIPQEEVDDVVNEFLDEMLNRDEAPDAIEKVINNIAQAGRKNQIRKLAFITAQTITSESRGVIVIRTDDDPGRIERMYKDDILQEKIMADPVYQAGTSPIDGSSLLIGNFTTNVLISDLPPLEKKKRLKNLKDLIERLFVKEKVDSGDRNRRFEVQNVPSPILVYSALGRIELLMDAIDREYAGKTVISNVALEVTKNMISKEELGLIDRLINGRVEIDQSNVKKLVDEGEGNDLLIRLLESNLPQKAKADKARSLIQKIIRWSSGSSSYLSRQQMDKLATIMTRPELYTTEDIILSDQITRKIQNIGAGEWKFRSGVNIYITRDGDYLKIKDLLDEAIPPTATDREAKLKMIKEILGCFFISGSSMWVGGNSIDPIPVYSALGMVNKLLVDTPGSVSQTNSIKTGTDTDTDKPKRTLVELFVVDDFIRYGGEGFDKGYAHKFIGEDWVEQLRENGDEYRYKIILKWLGNIKIEDKKTQNIRTEQTHDKQNTEIEPNTGRELDMVLVDQLIERSNAGKLTDLDARTLIDEGLLDLMLDAEKVDEATTLINGIVTQVRLTAPEQMDMLAAIAARYKTRAASIPLGDPVILKQVENSIKWFKDHNSWPFTGKLWDPIVELDEKKKLLLSELYNDVVGERDPASKRIKATVLKQVLLGAFLRSQVSVVSFVTKEPSKFPRYIYGTLGDLNEILETTKTPDQETVKPNEIFKEALDIIRVPGKGAVSKIIKTNVYRRPTEIKVYYAGATMTLYFQYEGGLQSRNEKIVITGTRPGSTVVEHVGTISSSDTPKHLSFVAVDWLGQFDGIKVRCSVDFKTPQVISMYSLVDVSKDNGKVKASYWPNGKMKAYLEEIRDPKGNTQIEEWYFSDGGLESSEIRKYVTGKGSNMVIESKSTLYYPSKGGTPMEKAMLVNKVGGTVLVIRDAENKKSVMMANYGLKNEYEVFDGTKDAKRIGTIKRLPAAINVNELLKNSEVLKYAAPLLTGNSESYLNDPYRTEGEKDSDVPAFTFYKSGGLRTEYTKEVDDMVFETTTLYYDDPVLTNQRVRKAKVELGDGKFEQFVVYSKSGELWFKVMRDNDKYILVNVVPGKTDQITRELLTTWPSDVFDVEELLKRPEIRELVIQYTGEVPVESGSVDALKLAEIYLSKGSSERRNSIPTLINDDLKIMLECKETRSASELYAYEAFVVLNDVKSTMPEKTREEYLNKLRKIARETDTKVSPEQIKAARGEAILEVQRLMRVGELSLETFLGEKGRIYREALLKQTQDDINNNQFSSNSLFSLYVLEAGLSYVLLNHKDMDVNFTPGQVELETLSLMSFSSEVERFKNEVIGRKLGLIDLTKENRIKDFLIKAREAGQEAARKCADKRF
ncbi:MAG: hypothetical protein V1647_00080 [Pseudomonadota bacterium]